MKEGRGIARECRTEVFVDAPIEAVWRVISDVTRASQWSHECREVRWLGGASEAALGVRFRGRNRSGWLRWSRVSEIIAVKAPYEIAWRTIPTLFYADSTDWRIILESSGAGTRIVQTYHVTKLPDWYNSIVVRVNRSHLDRSGNLAHDLRRIGAIAAEALRS